MNPTHDESISVTWANIYKTQQFGEVINPMRNSLLWRT